MCVCTHMYVHVNTHTHLSTQMSCELQENENKQISYCSFFIPQISPLAGKAPHAKCPVLPVRGSPLPWIFTQEQRVVSALQPESVFPSRSLAL